jgi:hypothetical protein
LPEYRSPDLDAILAPLAAQTLQQSRSKLQLQIAHLEISAD